MTSSREIGDGDLQEALEAALPTQEKRPPLPPPRHDRGSRHRDFVTGWHRSTQLQGKFGLRGGTGWYLLRSASSIYLPGCLFGSAPHTPGTCDVPGVHLLYVRAVGQQGRPNRHPLPSEDGPRQQLFARLGPFAHDAHARPAFTISSMACANRSAPSSVNMSVPMWPAGEPRLSRRAFRWSGGT